MPEPDNGHYSTEILNYGYVYTNLEDIEIKEDIARDYITIYTSKRRADYEPINLLSYYSKRHREKTRLSPSFIEIFLKEAEKYSLKKKMNIKDRRLDLKIISDWKSGDIDKLAGKTIMGDKAIKASSEDLQKIFDYFSRNSLSPQFYPEDRSVGRIKDSIYKFFEEKLNMDYGEVGDEIIQIVLSNNNRHFLNVIDMAKEVYKAETIKREAEIASKDDWNVPESMLFGSDDGEEDKKKSIMKPFYRKGNWKPEKAFIELLEQSEKVEWWFKNGDRDATFFAVPYGNGEQKPFYVDFIIKLKDGRIGLLDTKSGFTQRLAGPKVDGLFKHIQSENNKGKNLFGGIAANTDPRNYSGRWVYFDNMSKELRDNDFSNWENLEL